MPLITACLALALLPPADGVADAKIVGASLFKNGYAVVLREATIPASGTLTLSQPSSVALGTFWVTAPRGVTLREIVATRVSQEVTRDLGSMDEILQANKGKEVSLIVTGLAEGRSQITGKIVAASGQIIVVQTSTGVMTLQKGAVVSVTGPSDQVIWTAKQTNETPAIRLVGTPGGKVYYTALQKGLTWAPAYQVDISDPKECTITAKATILDDLEDIQNTELRLVTGFPNIPFLTVPDPFSSLVVSDAYLGRILQSGSYDQFANAPARDANGFAGQLGYRLEEKNVAPMPMSDLEGFSNEDLFFYRQGKVTLKKGDRGYYILLQAKSDYQHVYTLQVPELPLDSNNGARALPPLETWHELKIKNTSKQPLTTGTAVTVKDGELLGQDLMTYTPVGADQFVKITKALDITADQAEDEVSRSRGEIKDRFGNPQWDLVTIHGKIVITSRKKDTVKMKVDKFLAGEAVEADHEGKIAKFVRRLYDVNTPSKVTWEPEVKGGEKMELNYTYKLYQPSR